MARALDGVRVVECGRWVSGPFCAKLLADLGAEVIKVEEPVEGDPSRRHGPFPQDVPHPEKSGLFLYLNTNKLGITLDLATPAGKALLHRLAAEADILIEDCPPQEAEKLGLDWESLRRVNPRLVVIAITPFGLTGPYRDYKAYHLNSFHASGQGYILPWGSPNLEREPVKGGGLVGDYDTGVNAALATLAAFYWAMATGEGQLVDISQQESLMALERIEMGRYPNDGVNPSRLAEAGYAGGRMVGGVMACRDGYVVLTPAQERQWRALVELMGNPEWASGEKARDEFARSRNAAELNRLIAAWMADKPKDWVYHCGQALGCPIGTVNSAEDLLHSQQLAARGFFVDIDHPKAGKLKYPSAPYRFSKTPWAAARPAPLLGQHNQEVYGGRLGHSDLELKKMREGGII
ncbi:MAG: CoA transferase [Chloroflexota bacterium]|nr:CoA transferase [Chloroflexota bacterium]